jgi:branched-chain amino acid transport system ATP-binding protein
MTGTSLHIENLKAGYGGLVVLKGVSLDVTQGAVVALIGPNGHGKSTLLKCISGLVQIRSGTIDFEGSSLVGLRPHRIVERGIRHIPQGDLIFPDMSVYDNLMMGAYLPEAYSQASQRLEEVFALLPRLDERQQQMGSTLSGGERRMLAIGRGLMGGGRLLMIDEPSLGLAPLVIDQIYEVIARLQQKGLTILLVEENASRIVGVAESVYLLDDGQLVWQGTPTELEASEGILATYLGG